MAGIYLHIPFCKQACHYCNFHFSTSLRHKEAMVAAICREISLQKNYLNGVELQSVYFGGGTPSVLDLEDLTQIFEQIKHLHPIAKDAEITIEANPDDLTPEKLQDLRTYTPINRLSIGVQSFFDNDLKWMNRAHQALQARGAIEGALKAGFEDITVDLIYASPTTSDEQWKQNLETVFAYKIPHLSCYCLTVEEGTALGTFVRRGKQPPVDEEKAARQFDWLMHAAAKAGYEHYEISNFAMPGRYARHNTNYWFSEPYLGIGPSAHSFDGVSRQWNIANNALYLKSIASGIVPFEREVLTPDQRFNEYMMTSLRTMWGVNKNKLEEVFGEKYLSHFLNVAQGYVDTGVLEEKEERVRLTHQGKFFADRVAMEIFL
ncbi:MAG: radical SAM family heme chaperone HemW [Saprospiraceae bacterium]|nr:radical SAM family heme chaperone HemW [Saprospiraceae bacterium]